ncbi:CsgG/HfaB family protein [Brachyspira hampsonii]|uniref:Curli production assembly/transport component CsgG n=1 Tax=Brachyspira hampsonii 30446 TaxID=1289135 RepID=A0A2U4EZ78_9SPIR|nr:CsgG/HfaB family protein [Brachyspira hampsonii]EKV55859.1 curli production assembly/transport component CsgG [Brachyspira hampsonii 30446]MBW5390976.1 curli production assembly protein CsgG [Brachyspira hampsonii]MBW5395253.1 curli production assembly protein CsgG [Brachyspira hampsonii]OEJ17409.1 curli production assembly protein CsgG [Brachyspira hampsonii]
MLIRKIILLILILPSILLSQQTIKEIGETYEKENIAIFEIESTSSGYGKDLGAKMTSLIENSLTRMNRFNIVDRKNLDKYLKEMELQLTGITEKQVIEVGKIYGYSKAVTGKIVSANVTVEYNDDRSFSLYSTVAMVLQIVDVETTKILYSSKLEGSSYYSTSIYPSYSLRESIIDDACNDLAYKVENKMRSIFKITLTVADVDGGNVILLAGKNHGVSSKTRFKVYSKKEDIILPSGNVISGEYNYKGTLRIKELNNEYSIAKISRGNNIQVGDIARETVIGDFGVGIFLNYASYNIQNTEKIYESSLRPDEGKMKISLKKNEYALGVHIKMGYNGVLFSPNLSIGILFGDFFKSSYAVDTRFNFDININLYQEVLRLIISPYIGMGISFTTIGEIIGGNYYTDNFSYIKNGSKIDSRDIMFGAGAIASLQYNITDTIGLNLGIGYRFYTNPINLGVFSDGNEVSLPEQIKTVNLTGLEFTFGAFFIL